MRIRPPIVTGAATLIALGAVATVVLATSPDQAEPALIGLLWAALFVAAWGLVATLLLMAHQSLPQALWVSVWPAIAATVLLMLTHNHMLGRQLLGGIILATLLLSVISWWRLRLRHSRG